MSTFNSKYNPINREEPHTDSRLSLTPSNYSVNVHWSPAAKIEFERLHDKIDDLTAEIDELNSFIDVLRSVLNKKAKLCDMDVKFEIQKAKEEVDSERQTQRIIDLERENKKLRDLVNDYHHENMNLTRTIRDNEDRVEDLTNEFNLLQMKIRESSLAPVIPSSVPEVTVHRGESVPRDSFVYDDGSYRQEEDYDYFS